MKRFVSLLRCFAAIGCCLMLLSCQSTQIVEGTPGWENVTLSATGFGGIEKHWSIAKRIEAVQKAKVDAYARLESDILALNINATKRVVDLTKDDETLRKKISAYVRGAKIIRTENSTTGVKIYAELFLGGNFKATMGLSPKRTTTSSNLPGNDNLSR
ncbi:MAG: hypothetical protein ACE5F7_03445 [Nitrospiria bacterium]